MLALSRRGEERLVSTASAAAPAARWTGQRDLDRTLEAVAGWRLVLLEAKTKGPIGDTWTITADRDHITRHLRSGGNVGLVTHEDTGVAVLDPDKLPPWADMIDALGQPASAWVETASGRLHYYVAWQPDLPAKLRWDGQIIGEIQRGPGLQQVVIPPSIVAARPYQWLVDPAQEPLQPLPGLWRADRPEAGGRTGRGSGEGWASSPWIQSRLPGGGSGSRPHPHPAARRGGIGRPGRR